MKNWRFDGSIFDKICGILLSSRKKKDALTMESVFLVTAENRFTEDGQDDIMAGSRGM